MPCRVTIKLKALFALLACIYVSGVPVLTVRAAELEGPVTLLEDNFESYKNTSAFKKFWPEGTGVLITNAPGGGRAVKHGGARYNRHGDFQLTPDATHDLVLSADFYDFATNTERRVVLALTNTNGQLLAIGLVGANPYVVKAVPYSEKTNWVAFRRRQTPIPGWHHIQARLSMSNLVATIDIGSVGRIDKKLVIPLTNAPPIFTEVCIGGHTSGAGWHCPVLVDNIKVQLVPVGWKLPLYTARPAMPMEPIATASVPIGTNTSATAPTLADSKSIALLNGALINPATSGSAELSNALAILPAVQKTAGPPPASNSALWAICAALAVIVGLLAYVLIVLRRATAGVYRSPEGPPGMALPFSSSSAVALKDGEGPWRDRAISAEALAAKQAQILQEKVGPELVEFAKETLVQGLYKQRTALAQTQASAQQALVDLEKRLADLDLPANDRLRAYEKRIAELEKDLETRNDEMRELTRATLTLIRKKMQEEREGSGPKFN
jgi:hypothetical protein